MEWENWILEKETYGETCEISGLHGVEYENGRLWDVTLMMEAVRTSEKSVYYNETTRRNIPEG
jgi:hypothetical protein